MEKREEFNRMIEDCKAGKIDMILTKSVSRFARNYVDCGLVVRELLALRPPVGVYFESDDLFTPNMGSEMRLSLSATMAQEESRIKSSAMNGQHTIEIVAAVSGSRETPVWCMVYEDMEYAEEAGIFANQQKFVKPLNPYDIFTANIEAGNDQQIIIKQLVESYGLPVSCNRGPNRICAVSTIEFICERYGLNALDRTLRLCVGTWEGESDSLSSAIIKGISLLITAYGDALRDDQFIERVGKFSPREVSRNARERKMGTMGYAEVMLSAYNKKTKGSTD